jgi:hypothetical protein
MKTGKNLKGLQNPLCEVLEVEGDTPTARAGAKQSEDRKKHDVDEDH